MSEKKEKHQVQYKKVPDKKKHYAGIAVPEKESLSGPLQMLKDVENFLQEEIEKTLPSTPVNIMCSMCRSRVGYIIPNECRLPLRGSMIHHHRGCEGWPLPLENHGPLDFICPHSVGDDQHLFIDIIEGHHDSSDTFLGEDNRPYNVVEILETRLCLCGCGVKVRGDDKEYTGLECWKRHMMEIHGEDFTTEEEQPQGRVCPCGCGGEVRGTNKFADSLNCYRRIQAEAKQAEIEDGRDNT